MHTSTSRIGCESMRASVSDDWEDVDVDDDDEDVDEDRDEDELRDAQDNLNQRISRDATHHTPAPPTLKKREAPYRAARDRIFGEVEATGAGAAKKDKAGGVVPNPESPDTHTNGATPPSGFGARRGSNLPAPPRRTPSHDSKPSSASVCRPSRQIPTRSVLLVVFCIGSAVQVASNDSVRPRIIHISDSEIVEWICAEFNHGEMQQPDEFSIGDINISGRSNDDSLRLVVGRGELDTLDEKIYPSSYSHSNGLEHSLITECFISHDRPAKTYIAYIAVRSTVTVVRLHVPGHASRIYYTSEAGAAYPQQDYTDICKWIGVQRIVMLRAGLAWKPGLGPGLSGLGLQISQARAQALEVGPEARGPGPGPGPPRIWSQQQLEGTELQIISYLH
ncbi:hypothetical protein K438DRAFT_1932537 [Mycena galopus ATCC 62051]|nr:hypothetical protein K438DRAFT_1932537 [Mycena galopus ATCC 62051]